MRLSKIKENLELEKYKLAFEASTLGVQIVKYGILRSNQATQILS